MVPIFAMKVLTTLLNVRLLRLSWQIWEPYFYVLINMGTMFLCVNNITKEQKSYQSPCGLFKKNFVQFNRYNFS